MTFKLWRWPNIKKHPFLSKIPLACISQPSYARKLCPRTRSDQIFKHFLLCGANKIARSARGSARSLSSIWNLNSHQVIKKHLHFHVNSNFISATVHAHFRSRYAWFFYPIQSQISKNLVGPWVWARFPHAGARTVVKYTSISVKYTIFFFGVTRTIKSCRFFCCSFTLRN